MKTNTEIIPWLAGVRVFRHGPSDPPGGRCIGSRMILAQAVDWAVAKAGAPLDQIEIRLDEADDSWSGAEIEALRHEPLRPAHW